MYRVHSSLLWCLEIVQTLYGWISYLALNATTSQGIFLIFDFIEYDIQVLTHAVRAAAKQLNNNNKQIMCLFRPEYTYSDQSPSDRAATRGAGTSGGRAIRRALVRVSVCMT